MLKNVRISVRLTFPIMLAPAPGIDPNAAPVTMYGDKGSHNSVPANGTPSVITSTQLPHSSGSLNPQATSPTNSSSSSSSSSSAQHIPEPQPNLPQSTNATSNHRQKQAQRKLELKQKRKQEHPPCKCICRDRTEIWSPWEEQLWSHITSPTSSRLLITYPKLLAGITSPCSRAILFHRSFRSN
jgi:hypothetical protein